MKFKNENHLLRYHVVGDISLIQVYCTM